jgi:hypothetical protein
MPNTQKNILQTLRVISMIWSNELLEVHVWLGISVGFLVSLKLYYIIHTLVLCTEGIAIEIENDRSLCALEDDAWACCLTTGVQSASYRRRPRQHRARQRAMCVIPWGISSMLTLGDRIRAERLGGTCAEVASERRDARDRALVPDGTCVLVPDASGQGPVHAHRCGRR